MLGGLGLLRRRRGRIFFFNFLFGLVCGHPLHLLHQALHPPWLQKRLRRLWLRIRLMHFTFQTHQAGNLVLLVVKVMHPRTATLGAGPQTPTIDLDGDHLRHGGHPGGQFAAAVLDGLFVALLFQFATNLPGEALDVTGTDLDASET